MSLNIIAVNDLTSDDAVCQIAEKIANKQYLHLCASRSVKDIRNHNIILSDTQEDYTNGCDTFNIAAYSDFKRYLQSIAFSNDGCIRVSDERYILSKLIDKLFHDGDGRKKSLFYSMRFQLHELYHFLLFYDINISDDIIKKIGVNYSEFEQDIFSLYSLFASAINAVKAGIYEELPDDIIIEAKNYDTVSSRMKKAITKFVDKLDVIILDDFFIFDEILIYLIDYAINQGKNVYLTAKYDRASSSLYDIIYSALFKTLNQAYISPSFEKCEVVSDTALNFVRSTYGDFKLKPPVENLLYDNSIRIIKPFQNRETEMQYIAEQVSKILRDNCGKDIEKLQLMLKNDIAVALAAHYGYNEQLASVLEETGLFVYAGEHTLDSMPHKVMKTFEEVYFCRSDFNHEIIKYENGAELTYAEKLKFFDKAFNRIKVKRGKLSVIAYPVGQYIFKIYDILLNGISITAFKILLYSNWQYNIQEDMIKWDKYLSDFKTLEVFFTDKTTLDEWISVVQNMLTSKGMVEGDYLLKYHPVNAVDTGSLSFFLDILLFIKNLVAEIGSVNGPVAEHLYVLKHTVIQTHKFISRDDASFEQSIIMKLIEAVDTINASPLIKSIPATYFAENLHAMLKDFESDVEENDNLNVNEMFLNLIPLENITRYKYCFFPLFEADKYPRKYIERFPYSREIIEILNEPEYGINRSPSDYKELAAHIKLEEYLFKNVLDFTEKQLIVTMTSKEDEHKNQISPFARDIAFMLNSDIIWSDSDMTRRETATPFHERQLSVVNLSPKNQYTLKELVTYKLCPRLYLHKEQGRVAYINKFQLQFYFIAVLFSGVINEFKKYNYENKKIYNVKDTEAFNTTRTMFAPIYNKYLPLFDIFTDYELADIRDTVKKKLQNLFSGLHEKGVKGKTFTVVGVSETPVHSGNGYDLILEYDAKIYDMEKRTNRISQNDIFLDFLVLKTSDNEKEPLKHYADMIAALANNSPNCDRVNLIYKMMNKINVQFDSKRYANDGIIRTDALVAEIQNTDFSYAKPYASKYCQYCPVNDVCKEKAVSR